VVVVADDGSGLPANASPGVGLASMRERAEGLGGSFRVGPAAAGASGAGDATEVEVRIPELALVAG
jgi:signal transduction histidine kinase